jgi:hypothetical protein
VIPCTCGIAKLGSSFCVAVAVATLSEVFVATVVGLGESDCILTDPDSRSKDDSNSFSAVDIRVVLVELVLKPTDVDGAVSLLVTEGEAGSEKLAAGNDGVSNTT